MTEDKQLKQVNTFLEKTARKDRRGFASMNKEKQKAIASSGGKIAHQLGRAHQFTSEEASRAGKLGGKKRAERSKWSRKPRIKFGLGNEEDMTLKVEDGKSITKDLLAVQNLIGGRRKKG